MKTFKKVSRYIVAIILTVVLITFTIENVVKATILDKNFVLKKLDETAYYVKIYGYIKENFKNYVQQSGFDESVLEGIITQQQVEEDTKKVITNIYNNVNEKITAEELKTKLNENIKKATEGRMITTEQQKSIDEFVKDITNEYLEGIAHFDFEKTIYNFIEKARKIADIAHKISLVAILILLVLIVVLNLGRIYRMFNFAGIALFSSGLFLLIANIFINAKINIQGITVLNTSFSFTLREILESMVNMLKQNGIKMLIAGIVLIIVPNLIHNILKYQGLKNKEEKWKN